MIMLRKKSYQGNSAAKGKEHFYTQVNINQNIEWTKNHVCNKQ